MAFLLGNLSVPEVEKRTGVKFPGELVAYMEDRWQQDAANIQPGKWHCFDVPFTLVCGDMETAQEIFRHLSPLSSQFSEKLQVSIEKN